jgi:hypothetical protein
MSVIHSYLRRFSSWLYHMGFFLPNLGNHSCHEIMKHLTGLDVPHEVWFPGLPWVLQHLWTLELGLGPMENHGSNPWSFFEPDDESDVPENLPSGKLT